MPPAQTTLRAWAHCNGWIPGWVNVLQTDSPHAAGVIKAPAADMHVKSTFRQFCVQLGFARFGLALTLALATALGLLAAPAPCQAADDRKALIQMGNLQRKAGDDLGALAFFQRAHAIGATPESFAQIGMCEFALNRFVDAEIHLAEAMKASQDPWIRKNNVALQEYVASTKSMLGWIEIVGTPAGAEVEVGGRPVGRLPLAGRIRVAAGEVNVRMDAPGYRVERQDVEVPADQVTRLNIDLVQLGVNESARAQGKAAAAGGRRRNGGSPSPVDDVTAGPGSDSPETGRSPYRTAGWITAGASVVLLGVGIGGMAVGESNVKEFNDYMKNTAKRCNEQAPNNGGATCTSYLDRSKTAKIIGYSALAGSALAAVVSVILLSANPVEVAQTSPVPSARALARSSAPQLLCVPSLTQLGGACSLTF
jgi:hypothetical protein